MVTRLRAFDQAKPRGFASFCAEGADDRDHRRPGRRRKSSAAKRLAARLGYEFLDTGAMFRAVAFAVIRDRIEPSDSLAFREWLSKLHMEVTPNSVRLNGEDFASWIRTPPITSMASRVAVLGPVRSKLAELQRTARYRAKPRLRRPRSGHGSVSRCRLQVLLTADRVERARRRLRELSEQGQHAVLRRRAGRPRRARSPGQRTQFGAAQARRRCDHTRQHRPQPRRRRGPNGKRSSAMRLVNWVIYAFCSWLSAARC